MGRIAWERGMEGEIERERGIKYVRRDEDASREEVTVQLLFLTELS